MPEAQGPSSPSTSASSASASPSVPLASGQLAAARPLTTIAAAANDARFAAIAALIAEWQPQRLLVGRPLSDDGSAA
jgi:putative Holliday junction resolvase